MNLKPGDLVLVKASAFKGKRKIRSRWEEETSKVVHKITTDIPSYEVTDQCRWSCILHQNQLLVVSDVGIPLCIGVHHVWDRCTGPTPHKPTSEGGEDVMMPLESSGQVVTQCTHMFGWGNDILAHRCHWMMNPMTDTTICGTGSQFCKTNNGVDHKGYPALKHGLQ